MKSKLLRIIYLFALVITLSGCATYSGGNIFDPQIVAGNGRYVTLYDPVGLPGAMEVAADNYCKQFNRLAQFQSMGGSAFQCGGRRASLCATYNCVQ
jgi:hypothetical protein